MIFISQETVPTCSDCGSTISGPYFTLEGGTIVCEKDYKVFQAGKLNICMRHTFQARVGNCERCGKLADGKIFNVSGGFYHQNCLTCMVRLSAIEYKP